MKAVYDHSFFADKCVHAVTELSGGLNHTVCRVSTEQGTFITRSHPKRQTNVLELELQNRVATLGFCAAVIEHDEHMAIIEYIDCHHQVASFWSQEILSKFARQLCTIHQLKPIPGLKTLDIREEIGTYHQQLNLSEADTKQLDSELRQLETLSDYRPTLGLCHNDLNPKNILCDGYNRYLADWEYAAMGDVFFDLAGFIVEHKLNDEQQVVFLAAYMAQQSWQMNEEEVNGKLEMMKTAYRLICRLWHRVHQTPV